MSVARLKWKPIVAILNFKALGIALLIYAFYAITRGAVYARSGAWGRTVTRVDSPGYFWAVIVIYTGLSLALLFVF